MIRDVTGHGAFSIAGGRAEDGKPSQLKEKVAGPTDQKAVERSEQPASRVAESPAHAVVSQVNREVHYEIDDDLKRVVTKILDGKSGELVRQIPSEEALRLAKVLDSFAGEILDKRA